MAPFVSKPSPRGHACVRGAWVLVAILLAGIHAAGARELVAQGGGGSTSGALAGAALGLYSGGMLGVVGGLLPCDRTLHGRVCVAASGSVGAATGLIGGGVIGHRDEDQVRDRARGAAYGALIGTGLGFVLQQAVRQYAWNDALLVGAYGAAVGAAPRGTLVGTGLGMVVGAAAWAFSPHGGVQDLIMFTVVGSALGGLLDWGERAVNARRGGAGSVTSTFSIPVG